MTNRFKLIAAALGLLVASAAISDASAETIAKPVAKTVTTRHLFTTKMVRIVGRPHHRLHFGNRILVRNARIARHAPILVRVVKTVPAKRWIGRTVAVKTSFTKKVVAITRAPLVRHAMNHRAGTKVTAIR